MHKYLLGVCLALGGLVLTGCSSTQQSESQNYALTSIYTAIEKAMGMGIQRYSDNHREFYSRPFLVKQSEDAVKNGYHERGAAKVVVLGAERPYTLESEVSIQRSTKKKPKRELKNEDYEFERYDKRLANELLKNIISILDKRERGKNAVDDFRPF
jgi:hypothetical protein